MHADRWYKIVKDLRIYNREKEEKENDKKET